MIKAIEKEFFPILKENHLKFLFGGNATLTILNTNTENRFTFRVKQSNRNEKIYFVSVLAGPDNTRSYVYLGYVRKGDWVNGQCSIFFRCAQLAKLPENRYTTPLVFAWLLGRLEKDNLPEEVELYHSGTCACCNRKLTTPESIKSGIGPICEGRN
jgi:hypothetical protein